MQVKSTTLKVLLAAGLASGVAAPVLAADTVAKTWQEMKTKAFEAFDKQTVTVDFKTGSAVVDASEVSDLKALLDANKRESAIDRIIVAAWADKDYPVEKGATLSETERKLGDARAARVKDALQKLGVANVDTYAMTEQPTWLNKAFNLSDAKVKGEGQTKDAEDAYIQEVGKKLRDKGGPGKAVVYVRHTGEMAAH